MKVWITDIQRFCMHDGPGIRTTVFMKGCPLKCKWCHNPETQNRGSEIMFYENKCLLCGLCTICPQKAHVVDQKHVYNRVKCIACGQCIEQCPGGALEKNGKEYDTGEIIDIVMRDRAFYGDKGGITLSGGEPMYQPRAALELLKLAKEKNITTAMETCGYFNQDLLDELVGLCDLFLWDVKDTEDSRHIENTGVSNQKILDNLYKADSLGAVTRLRCIMVNNVNIDKAHLDNISDIYHKLNNCQGVDLMPYHAYGDAKGFALGREEKSNKSWIPSKEDMEEAKKYLAGKNVPV